MSYFDPIGMFDAVIPAEFLENSLRCLFDSYQAAEEACRAYQWQERHDVRPHIRRAIFEGRWRDLAKDYRELAAAAQPNALENCFHTEIACGCVVLTESAVEQPSRVVRGANFRETLARDMVYLFKDLEPPPEARLYSILIHGPAPGGGILSAPGFADIVFPDKDCRRYLCRIPLFERFGDLVAARTSFTEEIIPDEIEPRLRTDMPHAEAE